MCEIPHWDKLKKGCDDMIQGKSLENKIFAAEEIQGGGNNEVEGDWMKLLQILVSVSRVRVRNGGSAS